MNRKVTFIFVASLLIFSTLVFFYGQPQTNTPTNLTAVTTEESGSQGKTAPYQNITDKELNDLITSGKELILIDVREPDEFQGGYIQGAVNIPLGQLESRLKEIPQEKTVVVYCRSGKRSAEAAKLLVKSGYTKIVNLEGGIINWTYQVVKQQATLDVLSVLRVA